jgi:hypothetical protein
LTNIEIGKLQSCLGSWSELHTNGISERRLRAKTLSANIACANTIHSIADNPIHCLAAAQCIEWQFWA